LLRDASTLGVRDEAIVRRYSANDGCVAKISGFHFVRCCSNGSLLKVSGARGRNMFDFKGVQLRVQDQVSGLRQQLSDRAPILRAKGLGRVPLLAARVLRKLDEIGWLGKNLFVVRTNALFAYEVAAALQIESAMLATGDVDVLYDVRRRLRVSGDVDEHGLIGVLRQVDRSFSRATNKTYTAANRDG
jgi:hypothetical protein